MGDGNTGKPLGFLGGKKYAKKKTKAVRFSGWRGWERHSSEEFFSATQWGVHCWGGLKEYHSKKKLGLPDPRIRSLTKRSGD